MFTYQNMSSPLLFVGTCVIAPRQSWNDELDFLPALKNTFLKTCVLFQLLRFPTTLSDAPKLFEASLES